MPTGVVAKYRRPAGSQGGKIEAWHVNADCIHRRAVDDMLGRVDAIAGIRSVATLAETRAWSASGGQPGLLLLQSDSLGPAELTTIRGLKAEQPWLRLIMYGHVRATAALQAIIAEFDAVIAPSAEPERFLDVLRFVLLGNRYVAPEILAAGLFEAKAGDLKSDTGSTAPLLDDLPIGIMLIQGERVLMANRYCTDRFGQSAEALTRLPSWNAIVAPRQDEPQDSDAAPHEGPVVSRHLVLPVKTLDGQPLWVETFNALTMIAGIPARLVVVADVTSRMADVAPDHAIEPGVNYLAPYLAEAAQRLLAQETMSSAPAGSLLQDKLTARQQEVLALLGTGASNRDIAGKLGISVPTVKLHVHGIMRALGAPNRTAAALMARQTGPYRGVTTAAGATHGA